MKGTQVSRASLSPVVFPSLIAVDSNRGKKRKGNIAFLSPALPRTENVVRPRLSNLALRKPRSVAETKYEIDKSGGKTKKNNSRVK